MGDITKVGLRLFIITAVAAMALGLTNAATARRIEEQSKIARIEAKSQVLPQALEFEKLDVEEFIELHPMLLEVHEGKANGEKKGYTFRVLSEGFAEIELYVGIDAKGRISGVNVVSQRETPGLGTRAMAAAYTGQFVGLSAQNVLNLVKVTPGVNEIQAVSGATVSSRAVVNAVNAAIEFHALRLKEGGDN
jgi:electron transport complex protein RnfG